MKPTRLIATLLAVGLSFAVSACGGGGTTNGSSSSGTAQVRFINGAPDLGNVDVLINGKVVVSALSYRSISSYQSITTGTNPLPAVIFNGAGTSTNIFPQNSDGSAATFRLGSSNGSNLTIVIEGRKNVVGAAGLNLAAFTEPVVTTTSGNYSVVFHHASPSAALASPSGLDVGTYTNATTPVYTRLGLMLFSSSTGTASSIYGVSSLPAVASPGTGFFTGPTVVATAAPSPVPTASGATASPSPSPSPTPSGSTYFPTLYARILPGPAPVGANNAINGVDAANTTNTLPFQNDVTLFLYAIDSNVATGVELIGTFTN